MMNTPPTSTTSSAFFLVHPMGEAALNRCRAAISATAATAAIASGGANGQTRAPALGLAALAPKTPGGGNSDVRIQLLVRPARFLLRELHVALDRLPALAPPAPDGSSSSGSISAAEAGADSNILGMAIRTLLEQLMTGKPPPPPPHAASAARHMFVIAPRFKPPSDLLLKVLHACAQLGVRVHFVQLAEPAPLRPLAGLLPEDALPTDDSGVVGGGASVGGEGDEGAAAFAAAVAGVKSATFARVEAGCDEAAELLAGAWLRELLAPPPLALELRLPRPVGGRAAVPLLAVPRLLALRPLLRPAMVCARHGRAVLTPSLGTALDDSGWPVLESWHCAEAGGSNASGGGGGGNAAAAAAACAPVPEDALLQLGLDTVLRVPRPAMEGLAGGFSHAILSGGGGGGAAAVALFPEAAIPYSALDAQLLLGPALLIVPSEEDEERSPQTAAAADASAAGSDQGGGGGGSLLAPGAALAAVCASLRARGQVLLCTCRADLEARRALPVKQWCALQPAGEGASMLLWRLASAEQLLPPDARACAAAAAANGEAATLAAAAAAVAEAEAAAALDGLPDASALKQAAGSNGSAPPPLRLPSGIAAWATSILRSSTSTYVAPPMPTPAPARQAPPECAAAADDAPPPPPPAAGNGDGSGGGVAGNAGQSAAPQQRTTRAGRLASASSGGGGGGGAGRAKGGLSLRSSTAAAASTRRP